MKNYHVIFVVQYLAPTTGGPAFTAPPLANALERFGISSEFITTDVEDTTRATTIISEKRVAASKLKIAEVLTARHKENLVFLHNNGVWRPINHCAAVIARRKGIPSIVCPHGMLTPWALNQKKLKKALAWRLYQRKDLNSASVLHATSQQEAGELRNLGLSQPIAIIPNGIDTVEWKDPGKRNGSHRTALFLSRIHPKKGLLNLVEAWARIRPAGWKVVIAGPDEAHRSQVDERIRENGLQEVFSFHGPVSGEAKWDLYRASDLFVLPTFSENFGLVVGESLSCGVPVITTKGAPWSELQSSQCGWWIDIGVDPLAAALKEATLLSDKQRREMGARGRELVERKYQWSSAAKSMIALFDWIAGKNGQKPEFVGLSS